MWPFFSTIQISRYRLIEQEARLSMTIRAILVQVYSPRISVQTAQLQCNPCVNLEYSKLT